jgi:anthrone oxygenase-like protein
MYELLQVLSILLVSVGMALSLAHALELPGKRRLQRETYFAVQTIYYPGFTIGGMFGEFGAILATVVLLLLTPAGTVRFWLVLAGLVCLGIMHALYWMFTHPVNKVWLENQDLRGPGAYFFGQPSEPTEADWTFLRDRWEMSHVARAVFAMSSLAALVVAGTLRAA